MRMVFLEGLQKDVAWVQNFLDAIERSGPHAPTDTMRRIGDGVAALSVCATNRVAVISGQVGYADGSTEMFAVSTEAVGVGQPGWAVLDPSVRRHVVEDYVAEQTHKARGEYPQFVNIASAPDVSRPVAPVCGMTASFRAESAADAFELIKACWEASVLVTSFRYALTGDVADVACEIVTSADLEALQRIAASVEDGHVMLETLRACAVADNSLERDPLVRARLFARERQSGLQDLPGAGF